MGSGVKCTRNGRGRPIENMKCVGEPYGIRLTIDRDSGISLIKCLINIALFSINS